MAGFVIAATWTFCAMKLFLIGVMAINLVALVGWAPETFPYATFQEVVGLLALGNLTVQFVAGVLSLIWIYRVSKNAQRRTGHSLPISPGWAVGWYFIPIGALWKPFEAIEQTWKASIAPLAWRAVPTPSLLRWWWGVWLAGGVAGGLFGFLGQMGMKSQIFTSSMLIVISAIVVGQCVLFNRVVRRLTDLQTSTIDVGVFD
ncbi:DUF4328 domain-containing protein [Caulobacter sp. LARHSG274]